MGNDSSRRKALLVLTHALAFALPFVSGVAFVRYDLKPRIADLNALIAKSYSGQVASFDVAAGDDRAAVAGLRRHMDRTTALRKGVVSVGGKGDYFLAAEDCMVLSEIAFLSDAAERDVRVAEAAAICQSGSRKASWDARCVLDFGASVVKIQRGSE